MLAFLSGCDSDFVVPTAVAEIHLADGQLPTGQLLCHAYLHALGSDSLTGNLSVWSDGRMVMQIMEFALGADAVFGLNFPDAVCARVPGSRPGRDFHAARRTDGPRTTTAQHPGFPRAGARIANPGSIQRRMAGRSGPRQTRTVSTRAGLHCCRTRCPARRPGLHARHRHHGRAAAGQVSMSCWAGMRAAGALGRVQSSHWMRMPRMKRWIRPTPGHRSPQRRAPIPRRTRRIPRSQGPRKGSPSSLWVKTLCLGRGLEAWRMRRKRTWWWTSATP